MATPPASDSPFRPWHLWYSRLFALVGIGFIVYGCVRLWQTHDFVARAVHAQGTVVDYKVLPPHKQQRELYSPIVRFVDPTGKSWEKNVGPAELSRAFPLGHPMEIVYAPEHPDQFVPNTRTGIWFFSWFFVGIGAFAALLGWSMTVYVRNKLRHPGKYHPRWWDRWFVPLKLVLRLLGG